MCLNQLLEPVITRCAHVYCRRCIENVISMVRAARQGFGPRAVRDAMPAAAPLRLAVAELVDGL